MNEYKGITLPDGTVYSSLPPGGTAGQYLGKLSEEDNDVGWKDIPSGGEWVTLLDKNIIVSEEANKVEEALTKTGEFNHYYIYIELSKNEAADPVGQVHTKVNGNGIGYYPMNINTKDIQYFYFETFEKPIARVIRGNYSNAPKYNFGNMQMQYNLSKSPESIGKLIMTFTKPFKGNINVQIYGIME